MNIHKDLFNIFQQLNSNDYDTYTEIVKYIQLYDRFIKGNENAIFYSRLNYLSNELKEHHSHEKISSEIDRITQWQDEISDEYNDFLP